MTKVFQNRYKKGITCEKVHTWTSWVDTSEDTPLYTKFVYLMYEKMVENPVVTPKLLLVYTRLCENTKEYITKNLLGIIPKKVGFHPDFLYYTYIIFNEN